MIMIAFRCCIDSAILGSSRYSGGKISDSLTCARVPRSAFCEFAPFFCLNMFIFDSFSRVVDETALSAEYFRLSFSCARALGFDAFIGS